MVSLPCGRCLSVSCAHFIAVWSVKEALRRLRKSAHVPKFGWVLMKFLAHEAAAPSFMYKRVVRIMSSSSMTLRPCMKIWSWQSQSLYLIVVPSNVLGSASFSLMGATSAAIGGGVGSGGTGCTGIGAGASIYGVPGRKKGVSGSGSGGFGVG
jgi:hypothetical protein